MALNIITTPIEANTQTVTLNQKTVSVVCENVIAAMINGLPEEAHTVEVFDCILDESKEVLRNKVIELK